MDWSFSKRPANLLWQVLFLILGTSWLWAPYLNPGLSYRTSLISQYESPHQPYSWLFRTCDFLAGLLLATIAYRVIKSRQRTAGWILLAISIGLMADPLLNTTCRDIGDTCQEYFSFSYLLHATETVFTSTAFFTAAIYDSYRRKKLVSISFAVFQFIYGLLFVSQLADKDVFNTAAQYLYQTSLIVWAAWYCRDLLAETGFNTSDGEKWLIKNLAAAWAFINGVLAIVLSLAHLNLLGRIRGLYFTGNSAWLAQHGIIVGIIMLYLSRHLARGEARARQIFLLLTGIETLKYAIISPDAGLMLFYLLTFCGLFIVKDDFDRGNIAVTWSLRLRDLYFLVAGLLLSAFIALVALDRDNRVSVITGRAIDHLSDYVVRHRRLPHRHLESVLLAHSISVFLITSLVAVFWVLFRPYKTGHRLKNLGRVEQVLKQRSNSSEDYFKLWPRDKQYFWNASSSGFIAYRVVGPSAFGLADPIGPQPLRLIKEFNKWCNQHRLKVCYLPVYPKSLALYEKAGLQTMQIGSSAVIDIRDFVDTTAKDKWWRWRINKAQKNGYEYQVSKPPHSPELIRQLKTISDAWLKTGGHAERGFALGHFDRKYLNQCPIHCLVDKDQRIIAFTNQLPQFKKSDVITIDLLRYLPEFNDSMAFLLYKTIEGAGAEFKYFDLGFVPFARAKGPLLAIAKAFSAERFSASGLEQFKNKFDPKWQPNYMAYGGDLADLAIIALNIEKLMGQI